MPHNLTTMLNVGRCLQEIEETNSIPTKISILKKWDSPLLRQVLVYALDPYRVYHIKKLNYPAPTNKPIQEEYVFDELFNLLDQLNKRWVTGNAAKEGVGEVLRNSGLFFQLFQKIILKDLKCGLQGKTVNKAFKKLIPEFSVMKARDWEDYKHKAKWPMIAEVKMDGKRITSFLNDGKLERFVSRNGLEEKKYDHIKAQLEVLGSVVKGYIIPDGELMWGMFGDRDKDQHLKNYVIFDLLTEDEWTERTPCMLQEHRTERVLKLFEYAKQLGLEIPNLVPTTIRLVHNEAEVNAFYEEVVNSGGEGLMLKAMDGVYEKKRSRHWLKLKPEHEVDLEIVGVYEGEEGSKYVGCLGGIIVKLNGKKQRVGGGFSDNFRVDHWKDQGERLIGVTATVKYTELTPDGNFRFARFKELRDDK